MPENEPDDGVLELPPLPGEISVVASQPVAPQQEIRIAEEVPRPNQISTLEDRPTPVLPVVRLNIPEVVNQVSRVIERPSLVSALLKFIPVNDGIPTLAQLATEDAQGRRPMYTYQQLKILEALALVKEASAGVRFAEEGMADARSGTSTSQVIPDRALWSRITRVIEDTPDR